MSDFDKKIARDSVYWVFGWGPYLLGDISVVIKTTGAEVGGGRMRRCWSRRRSAEAGASLVAERVQTPVAMYFLIAATVRSTSAMVL